MPEFTTDWTDSIRHWPTLLAPLAGKPNLRFLEIGCFEGRTTLWLLENVLTDPSSSIVVVDPFVFDGQLNRFDRNLAAYSGKVRIYARESQVMLRESGPWGGAQFYEAGEFDFIYVDGSHAAQDVLADAVLSWPLLKPGGTIVFDDYWWPGMGELDSPGIAVDAFVRCYARMIADHGRTGRDQYRVTKL